ncbi:MAG: adenosine kinase [Spirulina sp. SIO3F2]|nr:adenosine kinase [Spirulina sp. SIO3F2]
MYDVYGIGNAMVDMEFEVKPEFLKELSIDKGIMTLVDEARQTEILNTLNCPASQQSGGGSAANTLVTLGQLGGKGFYSCKVADDSTGNFFVSDLIAAGLDTNLQQQPLSPTGTTGKCLVFVTPDADRTMNTFLGITSEISHTEIVPEALKSSTYLYMEGYLVSSPTAKDAAIAARDLAQANGVKTSFSLSDPTMTQFFREGLLEIIGTGLDLIFANETEALTLTQTTQIDDAIPALKQYAQQFVITRGGQGSLIYDGQTVLEIAPVPVQAVDTNGAGDTYAGTFLYGITHGMDYTQAGTFASKAAAELVTQLGARLTPTQLQRLLG